MSDAQSSPLAAYGRWLSQAGSDWPEEALHIARRAVIDTVGCMMAGAFDSAPDKLWPVVSSWGRGNSHAAMRDIALPAPMAALFNGTAAHALDFDDNFDPAKAHASAVLVPALLAMGDAEDANLDALLDGYICGLQIMGKVGQAVNPFHRSRGWHATGTLGAIGAAAGCARMLRLDPEQSAHAISLSTSLAGGFMSQFGSDTKPLHAGLAAAGGVQAALFARGGITAGSQTLDGKNGLRWLMVGQDVEDLATQMEGTAEHGQTMRFGEGAVGAPLHIVEHGLKVKRFPNCGSLHRALDGLLALMEQHDLDASNIERVLVRAPDAHLRNLMHENPQTPAQAKFSLEYSLAAALVGREITLLDYTPEAIARADVRAQMPKITKEYVEKLESEFPTQVHAYLANGDHVETAIPMPVGSKAVPMSDAQLWAKLEACLNAARGADMDADMGLVEMDSLLGQLAALDANGPVRQLTRAMQVATNR
jgi:2-methylcitrate dehydratase PrpD